MTLKHATVGQALVDQLRTRIGMEDETDIGQIDALMIRRYARAVGETNPLYYDAEYARSFGYKDTPAPPNLLVSVAEWTEGAPSEELRSDGTELRTTLPGLRTSEYRLMGGGQDMTFHKPVYPGQHLKLTTTLREVTLRETTSGPMAVAKILRRYFADGALALEATETLLIR